MTTPTVAVGAFVFDRDGRILLVERGAPPSEGQWSIPGGKLEMNETLAQAVTREVREETGLVVEVGALACVVERMSEGYHYVILDYLARVMASWQQRPTCAPPAGSRTTICRRWRSPTV